MKREREREINREKERERKRWIEREKKRERERERKRKREREKEKRSILSVCKRGEDMAGLAFKLVLSKFRDTSLPTNLCVPPSLCSKIVNAALFSWLKGQSNLFTRGAKKVPKILLTL